MESTKNYIEIDIKKGRIGMIIGLVLFVICCIWYNILMGMLFAVVFTATGYIRIRANSLRSRKAFNAFGSFCIAASALIGSLAMINAVGRMAISPRKLILNFMIIYIVCLFFMIITANWKISLIAGTGILMVLCIANGFIFQFRGKELAPLDFLSVKTAANVAGQYIPTLTHSMFFGIVGWLWMVFALFSLPKLPKLPAAKLRLCCAALNVVLIGLLFLSTNNIQIKLWDSQGTRINGYFLNFFLELRNSSVDKPKTYSPDRVKEILDKHTDPAPETEPDADFVTNDVSPDSIAESNKKNKYPNIIVIMNESFADFRVLGDNFHTDTEITPFIDSMKENTIKGFAMSSVYGGNTANSEFEFLTGHSMAFLPDSSVPYQQYINDEIYSLPWVLRSYGYKCVSTHPYFESGWSRKSIYPRLGFVESSFIDDYTVPEIIREYVSDRETFGFILDYLKHKDDGKPLFMFGITMQNHGGYSYAGDNFSTTVSLEGYSTDYPTVEQYLTLITETDSAVEYLIKELEEYPEDTIVLFFGDHFPGLNNNFFEEVHGGNLETLEERMLLYKVPYFIWANYDIPESTGNETSLNYLSVELLETAGLTYSPFYKFLDECKNVLPMLNLYGFHSVADDAYISYSEASPVEQDWLEQYAILQYNNLIDSKNRDESFRPSMIFGKDLPPENIEDTDEINYIDDTDDTDDISDTTDTNNTTDTNDADRHTDEGSYDQ